MSRSTVPLSFSQTFYEVGQSFVPIKSGHAPVLVKFNARLLSRDSASFERRKTFEIPIRPPDSQHWGGVGNTLFFAFLGKNYNFRILRPWKNHLFLRLIEFLGIFLGSWKFGNLIFWNSEAELLRLGFVFWFSKNFNFVTRALHSQ